MRKTVITTCMLILLVSVAGMPEGSATEPNKADYTAYPVFMANTITPNIVILMDNSGSMDEPVYLDEYQGATQETCGVTTARLGESRDDAEEDLTDNDVDYNNNDLFIGNGSEETCTWENVREQVCWTDWRGRERCRWEWVRTRVCTTETWNTMVGIRFKNVEVPKDAVVTNAWITFNAYQNADGNATFTLKGEDSDDASRFSDADGNISNRETTDAGVTWEVTEDWYRDAAYDTPDLKEIVEALRKLD